MDFMRKFKPEKNVIKEFKYWVVLLREKQLTLGAAVIILKREVPSLSDMTSEEASELPEVIRWYELLNKNIFGAEKFNYVAAMMKDNFVHYHAFPRYSTTFVRYGVEWTDIAWPKVIQFLEVKYDDEVLEMIKKEMREF